MIYRTLVRPVVTRKLVGGFLVKIVQIVDGHQHLGSLRKRDVRRLLPAHVKQGDVFWEREDILVHFLDGEIVHILSVYAQILLRNKKAETLASLSLASRDNALPRCSAKV